MKKKNVVGSLVMAGLIVVSVPLGVNRSFSRLREDVESEYYYDSTGYAIYEGIEAREAAANNLITVAKRYVDQEPGLDPYIDDLEYRVKRSENTYREDDFVQEAQANQEMGRAAQSLYEQLEQLDLSEKDAKYPGELIAEMESEQDKIERSSYNDEAREYNARLEKFPANFLRHVSGVKSMGVFGPGSDPDPAAEAVEAGDGR